MRSGMADPVPGLGARDALVSANWGLPRERELRSILVQTVGVLGRLAEALRTVRGIREAFVFGPWAARGTGASPDDRHGTSTCW